MTLYFQIDVSTFEYFYLFAFGCELCVQVVGWNAGGFATSLFRDAILEDLW